MFNQASTLMTIFQALGHAFYSQLLMLHFCFQTLVNTLPMVGNGPGDWGAISGRVIPKTQKMVLDTSFLNT